MVEMSSGFEAVSHIFLSVYLNAKWKTSRSIFTIERKLNILGQLIRPDMCVDMETGASQSDELLIEASPAIEETESHETPESHETTADDEVFVFISAVRIN